MTHVENLALAEADGQRAFQEQRHAQQEILDNNPDTLFELMDLEDPPRAGLLETDEESVRRDLGTAHRLRAAQPARGAEAQVACWAAAPPPPSSFGAFWRICRSSARKAAPLRRESPTTGRKQTRRFAST